MERYNEVGQDDRAERVTGGVHRGRTELDNGRKESMANWMPGTSRLRRGRARWIAAT